MVNTKGFGIQGCKLGHSHHVEPFLDTYLEFVDTYDGVHAYSHCYALAIHIPGTKYLSSHVSSIFTLITG